MPNVSWAVHAQLPHPLGEITEMAPSQWVPNFTTHVHDSVLEPTVSPQLCPSTAACTRAHSQRKMPERGPGSAQVLYFLHWQVYGLTSNRTEERVAQEGAGPDQWGS